MIIQAKFKCSEITETDYSYQVKLSPVYSSNKDDPNYTWSKDTPAGIISLIITNKKAKFEVGCEYLINFEKVVAPAKETV
jgi:hypothetical protein